MLNRGEFFQYLLDITGQPNPLWTVLGIDSPDPRLRDVELLLRLIAWRRFSKTYRGNMKAFLDTSMGNLNDHWSEERSPIEGLAQELFQAIHAALKVFGNDLGRKFKGGRYERALNRALFEVQAYYFSFPKVRAKPLRRRRCFSNPRRNCSRTTTLPLQLNLQQKVWRTIELDSKSIDSCCTGRSALTWHRCRSLPLNDD